ncbi:MAG: ACP S-malonyltransferase [Gammaproteobacteria bacterium]|nr:ACP S-malonyltransferase [Gammaproteobacteria bacterium]
MTTSITLAMVFPGQGSQSVGMLASLAMADPHVRATFAEASEALGEDLWALVSSGPEARLNQTECTQPAMLTAGVAVWRAWRAAGGPAPARLAGHSLGEYTALVCAGALDFAPAVRITRLRGQLMQAAVAPGAGAMAAILGLEDDAVRALCTAAAAGQVVAAANFNAPGQVVIAGHAEAVARAVELARGAGARRVVPLPVSVPSHCALMGPAAERLAAELERADVRSPSIPVVQNADAATHDTPAEIRAALVRQLDHPVRWVETVRDLAQRGCTTLLECGPGKVLSGLNRRIDKRLDVRCIEDPEGLSEALRSLGAG